MDSKIEIDTDDAIVEIQQQYEEGEMTLSEYVERMRKLGIILDVEN